MGTSWYVALEQGRDVNPSEQILDSLAQALRLTAAERRHLFVLAQQQPSKSPPALPEETVSPALEQSVHVLNPHPAFVLGRRWNLLTWNEAAELVFSFSAIKPPHTRNMIWRSFTCNDLRKHLNWEKLAQSQIAQFRADSARYPGDPWFGQLIEDLTQASEEFRTWWPRHDVKSAPNGDKHMQHETLGTLHFHHVTLQVPEDVDQKVMLYTCSPETSSMLAKLL
jgi:transcriptional regulator with XRE-family HTH domain